MNMQDVLVLGWAPILDVAGTGWLHCSKHRQGRAEDAIHQSIQQCARKNALGGVEGRRPTGSINNKQEGGPVAWSLLAFDFKS